MPEVTVMTCCPTPETWTGFYSGKLAPEHLAELERHLDHCRACQSLLNSIASSHNDKADPLVAGLRSPSPMTNEYQDEPECRVALERVCELVSDSCCPLPPQLPIPSLLGDYRILGLIGRGGMGTVYRAVHVHLDREVALKIISSQSRRSLSTARFHREMIAHGKLDHPNVVRATDAGEVDGVAFLVMELVDGISFDQLIHIHGPFTVADACEIARQTAVGLQHLSSHGLVHRDIKPSNLMLSRRGEVKVLDFGLATTVEWNEGGAALTGVGQVLGTFDFIAPEQAEPGRGIDPRTDIYSLGCALYFLLVGKPPYAGAAYATPLSKIMAHTSGPTPCVQEIRPEVPAPLAAILTRMLAKSPPDRFSTPAEVAAALEPFCRGANLVDLLNTHGAESHIPRTNAHMAEPGRSPGLPLDPLRRPARFRVVVAVLVFLLLCGGAGATIQFWWASPFGVVSQQSENPPPPEPAPAPNQQNDLAGRKPDEPVAPTPNAKFVCAVALLGIEERGLGVKDLGPKLGDLLFAKLSAKGDFCLVDRTDLKKVLDEQHLSLSGAVKSDEAVKVGQLTGAKLLVTGSVIQADKKLYLVAKIISTETGRVVGASVEGPASDELGVLAGKLADAIDVTIAKQGEKLVPKPQPVVDRIAALNKKLEKGVRPVLWVQIGERHVGQPSVDPAAQTEVSRFAKETGFELVDGDEGVKGKADVLITGEGFSEVVGRVGGLVSVRARVELKAVDRKSGKVLAVDRQTVMVVDASEQVAGKTALQNAAADLAERILPKIVASRQHK